MKSTLFSMRSIIASWFFLLALFIAAYVVLPYALEAFYPVSKKYVMQNADPSLVKKAKEEGYTEDKIAEYLIKRNQQKIEKNKSQMLTIEAILFVIWFLIGMGLIILNPSSKKAEGSP